MKPSLCLIVSLLSLAIVGPAGPFHAQAAVQAQTPDHIAWVADTLKRMQTVKTGMTRAEVLKVFTTEGGLSTRTQRTYVSRDCPYFKVDIEFRVSKPAPANAGACCDEAEDDVVVRISRPYLAFMTMD